LKVWRLEKLASKCQTLEWSVSGPEHNSSTLESEDDTCSEPVSVPVGMIPLPAVMQHSARAVAFSSAYTDAANCDRR
ncbi:hypothetical protein LSAT2_031309, partial [Lamellibrachia satsuma]